MLAGLHVSAFPGFFLTKMGPRFLKLLYESFCCSDRCIMLVSKEGVRLIGFAVGTTQP